MTPEATKQTPPNKQRDSRLSAPPLDVEGFSADFPRVRKQVHEIKTTAARINRRIARLMRRTTHA